MTVVPKLDELVKGLDLFLRVTGPAFVGSVALLVLPDSGLRWLGLVEFRTQNRWLLGLLCVGTGALLLVRLISYVSDLSMQALKERSKGATKIRARRDMIKSFDDWALTNLTTDEFLILALLQERGLPWVEAYHAHPALHGLVGKNLMDQRRPSVNERCRYVLHDDVWGRVSSSEVFLEFRQKNPKYKTKIENFDPPGWMAR